MKAKFGAIVVDGSGKIGGHVFSKNRGGAYMRTKVTPSNPNTTAQQGARALLGSLSTGWAGLTEAQRASWNGAVANYASTDIFGDIKNPSGINLYVKLNANLSNSNQTLLTVAPAKVEVPFAQITSVTMDISDSTATVARATADMDSSIVRIQATPAVSDGISNVKSRLRTITSIETVADSNAIYTAYFLKFGIPAAGSSIYFSFAPITATGQIGVAQIVKATVQA